MMAAYFSAIVSTGDSCLMASSGNVVTDIIGAFKEFNPESMGFVRASQLITLLMGVSSLLLAGAMTNVLDLMLNSYSFMVSGLFVPVIGALFWKKSTLAGAMAAMLTGGFTWILFDLLSVLLPSYLS